MKVSELFEAEAINLARKNLSSLEGINIPRKVIGDFRCDDNHLTSLKGGPEEVTGNYICNKNLQLTSIEGCPSKVEWSFFCGETKLISLQGIHKLFKDGYIKGTFNCNKTSITSHILGLLLIPGLKMIFANEVSTEFYNAIEIINKHLAGERNVIDCQRELIKAGLKEFAKL